MTFLKRLFGKKSPSAGREQTAAFDFHRVFQDNLRLCAATSWDEVRRVVESNSQLLSDQGIVVVEMMKETVGKTEDRHLVSLLDQNQWLFMYCRDHGVEDALAMLSVIPYEAWLAETLAQADMDPLHAGILALMAADDPIATMRVIRDNPILLDKGAEQRLNQAIDNQRRLGNAAAAGELQVRWDRLKLAAQSLVEIANLRSLGDPLHDPVAWARTQKACGDSISGGSGVDRQVELSRSTQHLEAALEVFTQEGHPGEWAGTHLAVAAHYDILAALLADHPPLLDRAIEHYEQALKVYTRETHLKRWALAHHDLAAVLLRRQQGNRESQVEPAIQHLEQVLEALDVDQDPELWARAWSNLAIAYRRREQGDWVDNVEQAIFCSRRALRVFTRETHAEEWARVMNNLGNVYQTRVKGDRRENATEAVRCYEQALEVRTRKGSPIPWAITHVRIGQALFHADGDHETRAAEAVRHYELALEVLTREAQPLLWAEAQAGLGMTVLVLDEADALANAQRAVHHLEQAATVFTRTEFPQMWADVQYQLALVRMGPMWPERSTSDEQAIRHFRSAIEVYQPDTFPWDALKAARPLGDILFRKGRWADAANADAIALAADETLYLASLFRESKERATEEGALFVRAAYARARSGNLQEAVVLLERGRARMLAEACETDRVDRLKELGYEQEWDDFKYLVPMEKMAKGVSIALAEMPWLDKEMIAFNTARRLDAIRVQREKAVAAIQQIPGWEDFFAPPTFDRIAAAAHENAPLVFLCATSAGGLALIVRLGDVEPVWLDNLTSDNVSSHWIEFMTAYQDRHYHWQTWLDALEATTRWLWDAAMGPVVQSLVQTAGDTGITPGALLIPGGLLGSLPLHAAWTDDSDAPGGRRYALDSVCFRYVPSARSLNAARSVAARALPDSLFAVNEPRPVTALPLPNASVEVAAVMRAFSTTTTRLLEHEDATFSEALEALPKATVYHFACHGYANFVTPLSSGLLMAEGNLLTVAHLLEEHLPGARLAVLSACETGIPSDLKRTDEVVGMPAGFLQAGVAGVVASLWSVADRSTMMLMIRFYDNWRNQQIQPAEALWQAQRWMRRTNNDEKEEYIRFHLGNADKAGSETAPDRHFGNALEDDRATITDFSHPYYWAAFTYTGV